MTLVKRHHARGARSLLAGSLTVILTAGVFAAVAGSATAAAGSAAHDVIANLFEWNWNSVAAECTQVLGPDGYGGVQIAPPEESLDLTDNSPAHPWWDVYQPVSYQLDSRMGDRAQLAAMVTACHNAGVKVYADAVLNHMTGHAGGIGYAGTSFANQYAYPSLYSSSDFHYYPANCPNSDDTVTDYNNQSDVQECQLDGLADLYTEQDDVRGTEAGYLNDMESLGMDGFRLDSAKHMNDSDIAAIESKLNRTTSGATPFIYQEVMPGGAVEPSMYEGTGDVLEFTYGQQLKAQFQGDIANLQTFGQSWGLEPSADSVTFVDNHDTDRNGSTLSYRDPQYVLANIFHLAWAYGTPQVYASFTFSSNDQSPPSDGNGFVSDTDCTSGAWNCTDRQEAIAGMVGWHNAVAGTSVGNWWSDGSNAIAFGRGGVGFVAIDNEGSAITRTFTTGLPAGSYCDVISGTVSSGACTATAVTVDSSGNASITVPANGAVAIDTSAR